MANGISGRSPATKSSAVVPVRNADDEEHE
jgi:hypothetical protein